MRGFFISQMEILLKWFSPLSLLTYPIKWGNPFALAKFNKPIVSERKVLPMGAKKGIITLTLVISRESESSTVRRGAFVMFNLFKAKIKTKLEMQIEEYVEYKMRSSPWIAEDQKKVLADFIKQFPHTNISEIILEELEAYYERVSREMTNFRTGEAMKALRAFFRFHKRYTSIEGWQITAEGIKQKKPRLQSVVENVIIAPMKRKKVGRPYADVELIKKIKRLKDRESLSFRKIGLAIGKDVSHVYRMYRYNLTNF